MLNLASFLVRTSGGVFEISSRNVMLLVLVVGSSCESKSWLVGQDTMLLMQAQVRACTRGYTRGARTMLTLQELALAGVSARAAPLHREPLKDKRVNTSHKVLKENGNLGKCQPTAISVLLNA